MYCITLDAGCDHAVVVVETKRPLDDDFGLSIWRRLGSYNLVIDVQKSGKGDIYPHRYVIRGSARTRSHDGASELMNLVREHIHLSLRGAAT